MFAEQGATRAPHAAHHPLVFASSFQPLPTLTRGKNSGKQLDSKAPLRNNDDALFNSSVSLSTTSIRDARAPELPDSCRARSCSHRGGNSLGKLPPGAPAPCPRAEPVLGWMRRQRQGRPERRLRLRREIQLPATTSRHPRQPPLSRIKNLSAQCLEVAIKS